MTARLVLPMFAVGLADDLGLQSCAKHWRHNVSVARRMPFTSPGNFELADGYVQQCQDVGMTAWSVNDHFMVCAPRRCSRRAVTRHIVPEVLRRWLFASEPPAGADADHVFAKDCTNRTGECDLGQHGAVLKRLAPQQSIRLDFVIAGFSHSGTTTLHRAFNDHPDISMLSAESDGGGELHEFFWFASYTEDSLEEALGHLRQDAVRGVRSTWVAMEERVMQRLAKIPDLRIIVVFRDPVAQLDSMVSHGFGFFSPLGQDAGLSVVHPASSFAKNILPYWPRTNLLAIPFVHLKIDLSGTMARVFGFLGLNSSSVGTSGSKRHWLHRRPARLPVPRQIFRQSLCDIPRDWQPSPAVGLFNFNLPFRTLLYGYFALERRLVDAFLGDNGWPEPRLDLHTCDDDTSLPRSEHEYSPGAHEFCTAAEALASEGHVPKNCLLGDFCQRCCVFLQARCPQYWECCRTTQDALRAVMLPALQEALCHSRSGGCCAAVGHLQSP